MKNIFDIKHVCLYLKAAKSITFWLSDIPKFIQAVDLISNCLSSVILLCNLKLNHITSSAGKFSMANQGRSAYTTDIPSGSLL